jgi:hypothetical protein
MSEPTFEQVQHVAGQTLVREAWDALTPEMRQQFADAVGLTSMPNGRKRGRPASPVLDVIRETYPYASARSHARIKRAMDLLFGLGADGDTVARIEGLYRRPNGSFNAAGFEAHADVIASLMDGSTAD